MPNADKICFFLNNSTGQIMCKMFFMRPECKSLSSSMISKRRNQLLSDDQILGLNLHFHFREKK